ncbi:MAG: tetratricopeptide repeat protein [Candidatus Zixiibacteriota bacterium]
MKAESKRSRGKSHTSESCITSILTFSCLLIIATHFVASFFPKGRIWGINQWAYFSPTVTLPATFLALLFLLPSFNRLALNIIKTSLSPVFEWMGKKKHRYGIFSLLFFPIFWALRTKTHFLGDGSQILGNIESGAHAIKWTETLENFLHLQAFHLAKSLFDLGAETLYVILSCMAGSIFIFLCFLFVDFLGKERLQKILVFLILISMGSIQLFFGYVEHYTFVFLFVFGFLFLSLAYLEGKLKLIFPILIFLLACLFHVSSLYLLPSLFFLFMTKDENGKLRRRKRILLGIFAVLLVIIIFLGYKRYSWSLPPLFVPLIHDRYYGPGYILFSLPHLSDFLNQQLLISPVGLILILGFLICKEGRSFLINPASQFLLIAAFSQLLFNFITDPGLGASRDWDLFSAVGLGYTILGLYLLLKILKDKSKFEYLAMILVITSFHSTIPWIALNSCEPKSIQRFRNLLLIDPKKSKNGHFVLVKYFKARGQEEEIERQKQVQRKFLPELPLIAEGKNFLVKGEFDSAEAKFLMVKEIAPQLPTAYHNLGMVYFTKGELEKADAEYKEAIRLAPHVAGSYLGLANLYAVKGDMDSALELYKKAIFLKWPHAEPYYNVGLIYFRKGNLDKAEGFFKKTLKVDSGFEDAYIGLGNVYKKRSQFQKAIDMYQAVIQLKPDLAKAHLRLGMTYLQMDSKEEAIRELEKFLKLAPQSKEAEEVRNILKELRP